MGEKLIQMEAVRSFKGNEAEGVIALGQRFYCTVRAAAVYAEAGLARVPPKARKARRSKKATGPAENKAGGRKKKATKRR